MYAPPSVDRRRIERLLFIARSCPSLRVKAYQQALDAIKIYSLDYKLYQEVANECSEVQVDELWMEDARVKQESGLEKLDVELKNYQNNLIKESIRVRCSSNQSPEPVLSPARADGLPRHWRLPAQNRRCNRSYQILCKVKRVLHYLAAHPRHVAQRCRCKWRTKCGHRIKLSIPADRPGPNVVCYSKELCFEGRISARACQCPRERSGKHCRPKCQSTRHGQRRTRQEGRRESKQAFPVDVGKAQRRAGSLESRSGRVHQGC